MSFLSLIYILLSKYLVPLLFSIGLFYFFFGVIEYFIVGKGGDEGRSEKGRQQFLKSIGWLVIALIAYGIVSVVGWLASLSFSGTAPVPRGGIDVRQDDAVLEVPDIPRRND